MSNVRVGGLPVPNAANDTGQTYTGTHQMTNTFGYVRQQEEDVATAKTLDEGDCGVVQNVTATCIVTLPATVIGYTYKIINGATDGTIKITISPNASDKIMGNGLTAADATNLNNTLATSIKGDYIVLVGDGDAGWVIQETVGTWVHAGVSASASISPSASLSPSSSASSSDSASISF